MRRVFPGALVLLLAMAACAQPGSGGNLTPGQPGPRPETGEHESPPDMIVQAAGTSLALTPYTYCWGNVCADGAPADPPPDIGGQPELTVEFPVEGWSLSASFRRAGDPCAREQSIDLERRSPTTFALPPAGFAGTYDVDLSARGPEGGDAFTRFRWTTLSDGPLPAPEAIMGVLADNDGELDSYGVELTLVNLRTSPQEALARITVTAAGGESLTFDPTPESGGGEDHGPGGCSSPEGTVRWYGPDSRGHQAAALGEPPFTYTVDLVLDSVSYRGTATWPADVIPDFEPNVSLGFDPPLPALSPTDG